VIKKRQGQVLFDRVPPQSLEAERSVLGAMLLNTDAVGIAIEVLREDATGVFYAEAHQHTYNAMVSLFRKNQPIDAVTLMEQLTQDGNLDRVGGASYIAELSGAVPTSANVEYYARIVLDTALLRRIISTCTRLAGEAYEHQEEVNALLDRAEAEIFQIAEVRQLAPLHKIGDLLPDSIHRIENLIKSHSGITGLATGFTKLDEMLSGLQPSDMVILAARPSVGKTAFALNVAAHAATQLQKSVLIFSLEMSKEQLAQRLLCMEGRINTERLRKGFLAKQEFHKLIPAADTLSRAQIYIDDTPSISALDIRSKARRHQAQHSLDLIIIDYLQLMAGSRRAESRQVEISEISRSIKGLARELSIPVLALSQLSREADKDDNSKPRLSHLRESGAIEQDADVVMMLSRPPAHESEGNGNLIKLDVAKQRNGPTGGCDLIFDRATQRFGDFAGGAMAAVGDAAYDTDSEAEDIGRDDVPF
jgi:replicative DNA helicase